MANPKRRHSHSRTRRRRAHDHLATPSTSTCPVCGTSKLPHTICGFCGNYRGVQVIQMEVEAESGEGEKK